MEFCLYELGVNLDEYNNAQYKWIMEGLDRIRNIPANHKNLSKVF